jgi:5-methylcytosine-specific restriction endonuclease McrA
MYKPRAACKYGHPYADSQTEPGRRRVCAACRSQEPPRPCEVERCGSQRRANGLCNKHLMRLRVHGTTDDPAPPPSEAERFWAKVDKNGPVPALRPGLGRCWIWTGSAWTGGFRASGSSVTPRTWAWSDANGPVPDDCQMILSACGTDRCVNPGHLFAGTYEDMGALEAAGRDRCIRGHRFDVYGIKRNGTRGRFCAECRRIRAREWRFQNPEADAKRKRAGYLRKLGGLDPSYPAILLGDPCSYCGAPSEHIDHIVALSRGGSGDWDNLTAACAACNMSKSAQSLLAFMLSRATQEPVARRPVAA